MMSLAVTPGRSVPSTLMAMVLNGFRDSVWVAMTCSTSEVPMPMASAPNAPCVEVCESPHTTVMPGLGEAELRTHDVHDALLGVAEGMQADTELLAVVAQGLDLGAAGQVGDRLVDVQRRGVVVLGGDGQVRAAQLAAGQAETLEGLRGGHLMDQVEVDVEKVRLGVGAFAVAFAHHVRIPDFLGQCFGHGRSPFDACLLSHDSTETARPL